MVGVAEEEMIGEEMIGGVMIGGEMIGGVMTGEVPLPGAETPVPGGALGALDARADPSLRITAGENIAPS